MKEDDAVISTYGSVVPDFGIYTAPEIAKSGWGTIGRHPVSAVDSYGFGLLIFEVFNGCTIGNEQIGQTKSIPPTMHQSYRRLLNANHKARLSVSHFREQGRRSGGFFETPLIRLSEGIESLGLKSDGEREDFLGELDEVANDFPEEFFNVKVLPELLKSVEFGGGGPKVFASVMKIGAKISDDEYSSRITPVITRLFSNPDRGIRVCLLENLPRMIDHLPQKVVNDKIFPQMVTGFTDVAPLLREVTVKAVLTVVTKLSDRVINGELLRHLAKTSNDEQPGIRTNTTICLGKIARNLGANTRQKVLTAAFARSLRDPFVHARNAALLALAATSDLFDEEDCAHKIMPALCPSLIDKEKLVRDQANKTFDIYLQRTRKYGISLPESALPPSSNETTSGAGIRPGVSQNDTSWSGWAISSFTNKLAAASGEMQSKPNARQDGAISNDARPSSAPPIPIDIARPPPSGSSASNLHRQALPGTPSSVSALNRTSKDQFHSDKQNGDDDIDDSWGDMGEEAFFEMPPEELNTPSQLTINAFDDGGEPDFEGWLKAQARAKLKAPLPKGLAKSSTQNRTSPQITANRPVKAADRITTTGKLGSGAGANKLASTTVKPKQATTKAIGMKAEQGTTEDDWGDAWD
ncbi:hypothetical protein MMC07_008958 [Pseudocyphellaria aurata]|nr:hypothetical protein [Pseudocyphellaria aurata]